MTQTRKPRPAGDEGAAYTSAVMREAKRLRLAKRPPWSAERLAAEMSEVAIPWTRDTVMNLENGRRKRLAAHELLGLAYVLGVANPVDLIVPMSGKDPTFVVVPNQLVDRAIVRAWFEGLTGPLREWLQPAGEEEQDAARALIKKMTEAGMESGLAEQMIRFALSTRAPREPVGES